MDNLLNKIKKLIPRRIFKALQPVYHYLLSLISAMVYRWPSEELIVIGITGTTGKTTTTYLLAKMLQNAGHKVGFTSTAMFSMVNKSGLIIRR
jgi:UDP-N-acetylmuramoyl-L-alanyl-D-glutamate--2,6-diaminopimelate ligase